MNKQPEKTAQTKQSMIDAFWEISNNRGIDHVTISEITKKAHLNRGTFYVYFSSLEELLHEAENEILSSLREEMSYSISNIEDTLDLHNITLRAMETFGKYGDKLFLLLGKNGDPSFLDCVRKEMGALFSSSVQIKKITVYPDLLIAYITSAFTGVMQYWYETGKELSLPQLTNFAYNMTLHGITGLSDQNKQSLQ